MFQRIGAAMMAITVILLSMPAAAQDMPPNPRLRVETSEGNFEIELFRDQVPATAVNFLVYARQGYYDGTVFHRNIRDTIIQGGGFNVDEESQLVPKTEGLRGPILNEARQSLKNRRAQSPWLVSQNPIAHGSNSSSTLITTQVSITETERPKESATQCSVKLPKGWAWCSESDEFAPPIKGNSAVCLKSPSSFIPLPI